MLSVARPRLMKISAPNSAIGTDTRITIGSRKLSNCAASARNTMMTANSSVTTKPPDSCTNWRDCPSSRPGSRSARPRRSSWRMKSSTCFSDTRRREHADDRRRVELLEVVDALGHRLGLLLRDGRGRQQRAVGRADVVVEHLRRVEAVDLQHLRDDLVRAPGDREIVDVAAAERRAERRADVLLREPERRRRRSRST